KEESDDRCDIGLVRADDDEVVATAEQISLAAWRALCGRYAGRIDLRCDADGKPQLIEINPLAGLHPTHSDLPELWSAVGYKYVELIERIVESARSRIASCGLRIADSQRRL